MPARGSPPAAGASAGAPAGWHAVAHAHWLGGRRSDAIQATIGELNRCGTVVPDALVLQLAYYVFLIGDAAGAAGFLERQWAAGAKDPQVLLNLAACLSRAGRAEQAVSRAREYLDRFAEASVIHDILANGLHQFGRDDEARAAGTRSLQLKDAAAPAHAPGWGLPEGHTPQSWAALLGKTSVIGFSLWGAEERYLHGALHNLVVAPDLFPGWTLRFHLDGSVPAGWVRRLERLHADVRMETAGQPLRDRLCWRFAVANDPSVGRFLVRDVDSVLSLRERHAVDDWLASDRWFHAMRDWWTHTDLVLAGMWGGVAGVLPPLAPMLAAYSAGAMETPNVDQWFLRDRVWPYLRTSCRVHDRCFAMPGSHPWPDEPPADGWHVGQNEHAVRAREQRAAIAAWLDRDAETAPAGA